MSKQINNKISLIASLIANGIAIPHYCYHNDLSITGNCRVCLVELKNSIKPVVSCSTNVKMAFHNNSVYHDSALVKKARENILEFLLLNHPLDCPICDRGGDCDLQDQSLFFGSPKRRFYKFKRIVNDKELGPIVKTVMTRCIHCTRCVRFSTEIAGIEDLGVFDRGNSNEIGSYINKVISSELSGNVIDICPVGKLKNKTHKFSALPTLRKKRRTLFLKSVENKTTSFSRNWNTPVIPQKSLKKSSFWVLPEIKLIPLLKVLFVFYFTAKVMALPEINPIIGNNLSSFFSSIVGLYLEFYSGILNNLALLKEALIELSGLRQNNLLLELEIQSHQKLIELLVDNHNKDILAKDVELATLNLEHERKVKLGYVIYSISLVIGSYLFKYYSGWYW